MFFGLTTSTNNRKKSSQPFTFIDKQEDPQTGAVVEEEVQFDTPLELAVIDEIKRFDGKDKAKQKKRTWTLGNIPPKNMINEIMERKKTYAINNETKSLLIWLALYNYKKFPSEEHLKTLKNILKLPRREENIFSTPQSYKNVRKYLKEEKAKYSSDNNSLLTFHGMYKIASRQLAKMGEVISSVTPSFGKTST
jgi:hypothetical protein